MNSLMWAPMTRSCIHHRNSTQALAPSNHSRRYGKAAQLALTAVAVGVHSMSASAQTGSDLSLHVDSPVERGALSAVSPQRLEIGGNHAAHIAALSYTNGEAAGAVSTGLGGVSYSGVAQGPERIEIRQSGQMIRSTVVPAGPYTLADLLLIDRTSKVEVTTVDCDGNRHTATIDAASLTAEASLETKSFAPLDVPAEHVQMRQRPTVGANVQSFSAATAGVAAARNVRDERVQTRDEGNVGTTEKPLPVAAANRDGWGKARPNTQAAKRALDIRYQPVSLAARSALDLPVDVMMAYSTMVLGSIDSNQLPPPPQPVGDSLAQRTAETPTNRSMPSPDQLVASAVPLRSSAPTEVPVVSTARATLEWNPDTRAPLPYAYSGRDVSRASRLPEAWQTEFKRAKMLSAAPRDLNEGGHSAAIAYAAAPVSAEKAAGEASQSTAALVGIGSRGLIGEPYTYESPTAMSKSQLALGGKFVEPALRRYAQTRFTVAYVDG